MPEIPVVGDAINFAVRQVEWIIQVIKCMVTCVTDYLYKNMCNQMFPCLYDCLVGATFVSTAVEKKLKELSPFKEDRPKIGLNSVYVIFRCLSSCAKQVNLNNWESFASVLYCVVDQCVCFQIFGQ